VPKISVSDNKTVFLQYKKSMAGIYLHIPFCKQACHYCDFHFSTNHQTKQGLVEAMVKEIELRQAYLEGEEIETIYFGGGTPSVLAQTDIDHLLNTLRKTHTIKADAEITLEANPDDLTLIKLHALWQSGINRLSIGVQSFHTETLKFLNRAHDSASALQAIRDARQVGFKNISIDLIYAIPGETDAQWIYDIEQAVEFRPEHISCYSLTIEEKTAFGKWAATGKLKPEPDEVAARHFELLMDRLVASGYEHYEISNFSLPGLHSKHNSSYWRDKKYLGIGPSAHSYDGVSRQYAVANNHLYLRGIQEGVIPAEREILSRENKINEYILTSLRTSWGINLAHLTQQYHYNLHEQHALYLSILLEKKLATLANNTLRLTRTGKLLADKISSDLFAS
jgi:oxygen-independent coproporphyrinogen III oxidase